MNYLLVLFFVFYCFVATGQNMLFNGDFEKMFNCPKTVGDIEAASGWHNGSLTPDLFSSCTNGSDNGLNVPNNYVGSIQPFNGSSYAGIFLFTKRKNWSKYKNFIATESIWTNINEKIKAYNTYKLSICISLADSSAFFSNYLVASFSQNPFDQTNGHKNDYHIIYYIDSKYKSDWTYLSHSFKAINNFQYLSIGLPRHLLTPRKYRDFIKKSAVTGKKFGDCYYYLDAISLEKDEK